MSVTLTVCVTVSGGTDATKAIQEAIRLARELNVVVAFNFNGVEIRTFPWSNPEHLFTGWCQEFERRCKASAATGG